MQGSPLSGCEGVRVMGTRQQRLVYHVNKALKITFIILQSLLLRNNRGKLKCAKDPCQSLGSKKLCFLCGAVLYVPRTECRSDFPHKRKCELLLLNMSKNKQGRGSWFDSRNNAAEVMRT